MKRTKGLAKNRGLSAALASVLALSVLTGAGRAETPAGEVFEVASAIGTGAATPAIERAKAALERERGDACDQWNAEEARKAFLHYCRASELGDAEGARKLAECYVYGKGVEENEAKAFECYRRAAELGDYDATLRLVAAYFTGEGVEKNDAMVAELSRRAAETGQAEGIARLAACYLNGCGVEKDEKKGFELSTRAAKLGDETAMRTIAFCYAAGLGVERDDEKAFEISLGLDPEDDLFALGELYRDGKLGVPQNPALAFRCFEKSAEAGVEKGREALKTCYLEGFGVEKNERKANVGTKILEFCKLGDKYALGIDVERNEKLAFEFYEEAAKLGDWGAAHKLADAYCYGRGVEQNREKALEILLETAKQGDAKARDIIRREAFLLISGANEEEKEAALWQKLAEIGDAQALVKLGDCYMNGVGAPKNREKAFALYLEAEEKKPWNSDATMRVSMCYAYGYGVKMDKKKAFEKACERGGLEALPYFYASGCGVERNDEKALEICEKTKDRFAWRKLGNLYRNGDSDVPQNPTLAVRCFEEAAALGDYEACLELAKCYREGSGVEKDEAKAAEWENLGGELKSLDRILA